jgi:starch-binding outer membrane protein, SusD/RagB family
MKMKKIVSITLAAAAVGMVLFTSCNKLSESPQGSLLPSEFFKTQADAVAAVTATYSTLSTDINNDFPIYGRNLNLLIDNPSDNQVYSPSNTNPDVRALGTATYTSTNDRVHKIYAQLYWGIDKANLAIDGVATIPAAQFSSYSQLNLIREARFIRALYYFDLVRLFGDVPLVIHDAGTIANARILVARTSKDTVYKQIITDLDSAALLPATQTSTNAGRVTSGAALALLGKVYVQQRDWPNAVATLKQVITAGTTGIPSATGVFGYDLFSKFTDAFQAATKNGKEHVFSAQFNGGVGGGFVAEQNLSSFSWTTSSYLSDQPADTTVVNPLFNIADQRRTATFYDSLYNSSTGQWSHWPYYNFFKFVDQSTGITTALAGNQGLKSKINFPVIRYADVLLLYAEALNELNNGPTSEAYAALNIVRGRAYANPATRLATTNTYSTYNYTANGNYTNHAFDVSALTEVQFRDTIFVERRREFIQESQRWFDLVRRAPDAEYPTPGSFYLTSVQAQPGNPKSNASLKDTLFPIPQTEINIYGTGNPNFQQNQGW